MIEYIQGIIAADLDNDATDVMVLALSICHATHHTYNRRLEAQLS